MVQFKIIDLGLKFISKNKESTLKQIENIPALKKSLSSIQNVMKLIKNVFEGDLSKDVKKRIIEEV